MISNPQERLAGLRFSITPSGVRTPPSQHSTLKNSTFNIKRYESKYLENNFADCNIHPYSHRYYARCYQLHSLKVKG